MNAADIILAIDTITDEKDINDIYSAAALRYRWVREEQVEDKRKEVLYEAFLNFPPSTRVKLVHTGYTTLEGKTGTVDELESIRGHTTAHAHVKLDKGKGPRSMQCYTHPGTGCLKAIAGLDGASAWYQVQMEVIE